MEILKRLEKNKQFWFVLLTSFLFFLLRLPSLFEPLWYGAEGINQVVGNSLNHGKLLYSQVFDNKPPLLYWLYAAFQSDQFSIRMASAIFGILAVIMFFFLSKILFKNAKKNNKISFITTSIFAILFALPTLEGNIANAENFMLLPIISAGFLILVAQKQNSNHSLINRTSFILDPYFFAGLLLGLAFLFKIVAVFDLAAFIVFLFILNINFLKKELKLFKIIAGFFLPLFLVSLFFLSNGTFIDFVKAAFISNASYVSYDNKIGALPLLLFIKLTLLGSFLLFALVKRKKISQTTLFISIWFAFSLFNSFFSQHPYAHYLLVLIPSLSLMVGLILFDKKYQKIVVIVFLTVSLIIVKGFGVPRFDKIKNYYQNFISYVVGKKTTVSYQDFFDRNTPFDYKIARFIKPKLNIHDTVFVWGNNAQLYQLIGVVAPTKYVVAYHISNYKDGPSSTQIGIKKTKPKFIVIMANSGSIPFPLINYSLVINIDNTAIYEKLF